jgi:hypothetical protein
VIAFLAIAAPWHVFAWRASRNAFVDEYVVRQHVQRFEGGDRGHRAPVWFFVPGFLAGFFPWSALTVIALGSRRHEDADPLAGPHATEGAVDGDAAHVLLFLKVWFWVVFAAFSASGSKLISYILPLFPAAALLAGGWADDAIGRRTARMRLLAGGLVALGVLLCIAACAIWPQPLIAVVRRYSDKPITVSGLDGRALAGAAWLAGAAALGLAAFCALTAAGREAAAFGALAGGMVAFVALCTTLGLPTVQARAIGSLHSLTRLAGLRAGESGLVWIAAGPPRRPSALFYLPDRVLMSGRVREGPFILPRGWDRDVWLVAPHNAAPPRTVPAAQAEVVRPDYTLWHVPAHARAVSSSGDRRR